MITKKQKTLAASICVIMILAVLSASLYLIHELDHDCIGEECPICVCIDHARQVLKQFGPGKAGYFTATLMASFVLAAALILTFSVPGGTLVSQKVRLNN